MKMILARAQVSSLDEYREIQKQKLRQDNIKNQISALKSSLQSDLIQLQEYVQDKSSGHKKLQDLGAQISLLNENINLYKVKRLKLKSRWKIWPVQRQYSRKNKN
ncbi:hypothetical protein SDC49_24545 [Lactobacillus sp. R2/2]|nr:hypothetical protein [Lactobacillus sp. R2/2]